MSCAFLVRARLPFSPKGSAPVSSRPCSGALAVASLGSSASTKAPLYSDPVTRKSRAKGHGFTSAFLLVAACALLLGCEGLTTEGKETVENSNVQLSVELSPLLDFLDQAPAGEAARLQDPRSGEVVRIVAGRRYASASGRTCRYFEASPLPGFAGFSEGLACQDAAGAWHVSELIVNPEDLATPR